LERGRELYRKRSTRVSAKKRNGGSNRLVVGFGTIVEQVAPVSNSVASLKERWVSLMQPMKDVMKGDFKCLLDKVVGLFPKKEKEYDPLYESWKRGRRGF